MAKIDTKKLVFAIAIVVLGLLAILPLFIKQYVGMETSMLGQSESEFIKLFDKGWKEAFDGSPAMFKGEFFFVLVKISTIVALVAGIALAVLSVLKLLGISFGLLDLLYKIAAFVAIAAGAIVLIALLIFIIATTSHWKDLGIAKNMKLFGGWAWYVGFIAPIGAGVLAIFDK